MSDPPWSSPLVEEAKSYYTDLLRPVFSGRRFLHAGQVAVALGEQARMLTALGAERPFLIADSEGTGTMPTEEEAELRVLGLVGRDICDQMNLTADALEDLPPSIQADVDAWDPDREARWSATIMLREVAEVAGRRKYGLREPAWTALEDKVAIDEFWDAVGVQRAPSRIVEPDPASLRAAAAALDRGDGTVWAADAREGMTGGAIGLRWVRPGDDGATAAKTLAAIADRVRVMPFLEGVPVSIHGIVFPDETAVFRPVEMVVLRRSDTDRFLYAGCSTWFDPTDKDRDAMRGLARRVGTALRERLGYRGPFTIDGVLAEEGFRPTELNPRLGGGLGTVAKGLGDFPLIPLCLAATEGEDLDWRPDLLERAVVEASDARRAGGGWTITSRKQEENQEAVLVRDGAEYRVAREGEEPHGRARLGPSPLGGFFRFDLDPDRNEPGPPAAHEVI
ncbi:MAG: ATP-grasp domain-containing protein, partial [Planctomycetota bacterium]